MLQVYEAKQRNRWTAPGDKYVICDACHKEHGTDTGDRYLYPTTLKGDCLICYELGPMAEAIDSHD